MSILNQLLAEDVVFHSPVAFKPYSAKQTVAFILTNVIQVFKNFVYYREFYGEDGLNVLLEFLANIADKKIKGIDMIGFDQQAQLIDFELMIRPKSALEVLADRMAKPMATFSNRVKIRCINVFSWISAEFHSRA